MYLCMLLFNYIINSLFIGAIDGTLVKIHPPPATNGNYNQASYLCRKNFHALNVMIVSGPNMHFSNNIMFAKRVSKLFA